LGAESIYLRKVGTLSLYYHYPSNSYKQILSSSYQNILRQTRLVLGLSTPQILDIRTLGFCRPCLIKFWLCCRLRRYGITLSIPILNRSILCLVLHTS